MRHRVVLIRHGDDPDDDRVMTFFRAKGVEPEVRKPFKGDELGDVDDTLLGSVIYGGPFNVFEEDKHPFLRIENRWIEQCIKQDVPLLGICQGGQSIARVLGAHVGPKLEEVHEFGYYEIRPTEQGRAQFPPSLTVAQAHFHEFEVPRGAVNLASSAVFERQAFRYGLRTFAFQFHAEVTPRGFRRWQESSWAAYGKPGAQTRVEQDALMTLHDHLQHKWFMGFLDQLFGDAITSAGHS